MTLAESLLPKLSEWRPSGVGRHSWSGSFPEAGWTVQIAADRADSLSCLVWELTVSSLGVAPGLALRGWAHAIADRVTGLLEPLKVYEIDESRQEALLRSETPTAKGESLAYYEVRLTGSSSAVVRRFAASKTASARQQVPFALTHEVLAKLANDLTGA